MSGMNLQRAGSRLAAPQALAEGRDQVTGGSLSTRYDALQRPRYMDVLRRLISRKRSVMKTKSRACAWLLASW
jgi:hypothetical protein